MIGGVQVEGDFVVTARVRAAGRGGPAPTIDWSLTGLLLRAPLVAGAAENWIGYTAGYARGLTTERKTTRDNRSTLRLHTIQPGWIELRAVRVGSLVILLRRQAAQGWTLDAAYSCPDLPPVIQVGINAGTGFETDRADLVSTVDWIRFSTVAIPRATVRTALVPYLVG